MLTESVASLHSLWTVAGLFIVKARGPMKLCWQEVSKKHSHSPDYIWINILKLQFLLGFNVFFNIPTFKLDLIININISSDLFYVITDILIGHRYQ